MQYGKWIEFGCIVGSFHRQGGPPPSRREAFVRCQYGVDIFGYWASLGSVAEILYAKVLTILQFACKIKQK